MYNSNLALKNNQNTWNLKQWDYLVTEISNVFRFTNKEKGIYNPFVPGTWNYKQIKNKLLWDINKIDVPEIDWILTESPKMVWS